MSSNKRSAPGCDETHAKRYKCARHINRCTLCTHETDAVFSACSNINNCLALICLSCATLSEIKTKAGSVVPSQEGFGSIFASEPRECYLRCGGCATLKTLPRIFYDGLTDFDEKCTFPGCSFESKTCFTFMQHVESHYSEAKEVLVLVFPMHAYLIASLTQVCPACLNAIDGDMRLHHKLHCTNVTCMVCNEKGLTSKQALSHHNKHINLGNVCVAINNVLSRLNTFSDVSLVTKCVWKAGRALIPLVYTNPESLPMDSLGNVYMSTGQSLSAFAAMMPQSSNESITSLKIDNQGNDIHRIHH